MPLPTNPGDPRHDEYTALISRIIQVDHMETRDPEAVCLCACGLTFTDPDAHMQHAITELLAALNQEFGPL